MRASGLTAVVTGGAGGIGKATAHLLAREGADVVIGDVDDAAAEGVIASLGPAPGAIHYVRCDVMDASAIEALMEAAVAQAGGIDIVVATAGILRSTPIVQMDPALWDRVMEVNARSVFLTSKFAIPHLSARGGGAIVNMASRGGISGAAGAAAYAASKGAIIAFTKSLAAEAAPYGIRANCVCPGWVATGFNEPVIEYLGGVERQRKIVRKSVYLGREGHPEEIAECVLFLATDASSYITGQAIVLDGGRS